MFPRGSPKVAGRSRNRDGDPRLLIENIVFSTVVFECRPDRPRVMSVPFARSLSAMLNQYPDLPLAVLQDRLGRSRGWTGIVFPFLLYILVPEIFLLRELLSLIFVRINLEGMGGSKWAFCDRSGKKSVNEASGKARQKIYDCSILLLINA